MNKKIKLKRIKHISELPEWFQLKNYDFTKTLDTAGWYEQLLVRYTMHSAMDRLKDSFGDEEDTDLIAYINDIIKENPNVDIFANDILTSELTDYTLEEIKNKEIYRSFGIHKLTVNDFFEIERAIHKSLEPIRKVFKKYWSRSNKIGSNINLDDEDIRQKWINAPLYELNNEHSALYETVRINWELPDSILIEQFKLFIKSQRPKDSLCEDDASLQAFQKKCFRKPDFENWICLGILPYLDLTIWAFRSDITIPYRVMADAIYSSGTYGEETLRKTTVPLVDLLMTEHAVNALAQHAALKITKERLN